MNYKVTETVDPATSRRENRAAWMTIADPRYEKKDRCASRDSVPFAACPALLKELNGIAVAAIHSALIARGQTAADGWVGIRG